MVPVGEWARWVGRRGVAFGGDGGGMGGEMGMGRSEAGWIQLLWGGAAENGWTSGQAGEEAVFCLAQDCAAVSMMVVVGMVGGLGGGRGRVKREGGGERAGFAAPAPPPSCAQPRYPDKNEQRETTTRP